MAAISWSSNEIRDYLATKGVPSASTATYMQTYIQRLTALFTDVAKDYTLVNMLERMARIVTQLAKECYDNQLVDDDAIAVWILANHPEWSSMAPTLGDIIEVDINTRLFGSATVPAYVTDTDPNGAIEINEKQVMAEKVDMYLTSIARYMRYFAAIKRDSDSNVVVPPLPEW